jgi:hypothetical protein
MGFGFLRKRPITVTTVAMVARRKLEHGVVRGQPLRQRRRVVTMVRTRPVRT